ncbi:MAG: 3-hydroxyacyl-[acyl-carrier-protein] dehydratase FabZ [Candidatus Riflebacteria bacterium HGW-Riflebacteria-2]|jgi:UDP-3-O-[3-hydroxymyristoyl] N-acetylglucosamine deacetylase/3-hydroxyacyl-[acyl-carrier-protein] dehydratase|nr:MAG: 3-hydroxyacyl-[acyl-carrier-protein] dehydratase FabZ [Candidatus Riflebacteria bacterium HGW-Riflebacteria-2]
MTQLNRQYTLADSCSCEGLGLHTGKPVSMQFVPAPVDSGIVFVRTDLEGTPGIKPVLDNVVATNRGTIISEHGASVHTVEHVLAALRGIGVDNLEIRISSEEPPVLDGSAANFVEMIEKVGLVAQQAERDFCSLSEVVSLSEGDKAMSYLPSDHFEVTYHLAYPDNLVAPRHLHIDIDHETFRTRICRARTFGFEREFDMLKQHNLARGGSLENAVVIDNSGKVINPEGLRDEDELILHKILDLVGDFSLLGRPLRGHIIAERTGHSFNVKFAKMLRARFAASQQRKEHKMMYIEEIKEILPHRYPFLLVDRIISLVPGESIVGIKNVTANEEFFNGHFPHKPVMPGVLMVEAMAQVAGVLFLSQPEHKGKVPFFCGIDKVRFRRPVVPGDRLEFHIKVLKVRGNTGKVAAEARVDGELVTGGELMFQIV